MYKFFLFTVFFGLTSYISAENSIERENIDPFITNGVPANLGQIPYQVGILMQASTGTTICGGAFIKYQWVLTAAQCVFQANTNYTLVFGSISLTSNTKSWESGIIPKEDIKIHPQFNSTNFRNNIALIFVKDMPDFSNSNASPIELPTEEETKTNLLGKDVVMSGYGLNTNSATETDGVLRHSTNKILTSASCSLVPGYHNGTLCVETIGGRSTCYSDQGGPLAYDISADKKILVGIASNVLKPCTSGTPVIFESVSYHLEWIENTLNGASAVSVSFSIAALGITLILRNFL